MQLCKPSFGSIALLGLFLSSCAGLSPVYPARPPETPGEPIADPSPSRVVLHATITGPALRTALEERFPETGEGTVPLVGKDRKFTWKRDARRDSLRQGAHRRRFAHGRHPRNAGLTPRVPARLSHPGRAGGDLELRRAFSIGRGGGIFDRHAAQGRQPRRRTPSTRFRRGSRCR